MKKSLFVFFASASIFLNSSAIHADDTEIFLNPDEISDPGVFHPNVLFIFDTSGSMGDRIDSKPAYDPDRDYGDSDENYIYVYNTDLTWDNEKRIPLADMQCKAFLDQMSNADYPWLIDRVAWWDTSDDKWYGFTNYEAGAGIVECDDDSGIHGAPGIDSDLYAANDNAGPYINSAQSVARIRWNRYENRLFATANYHDYLRNDEQERQTKMDIMKGAAIDLVNNFKDINLGMMRFGGPSGGYVKHHFSDIESDRTNIVSAINTLEPNSTTPLVETLWEAHRYYAGLSVDYGTEEDRDENAISGDNYISPVGSGDEQECEANYIVYLTDGEPVGDNQRDGAISTLTGETCFHTGGTTARDTCLDEMAGYMASYDYNQELDGTQSVSTYTIGFTINMPLLEETARRGNGKYFTAANSTELRAAFNQILPEILSDSTSFVAPAISVNAFNSFQNNAEVYYALFEPSPTPRWHGNIKKYRITADGVITDADSENAIEENTGYFRDGARSLWSDEEDGNIVQLGGAAEQLTASRTIYTTTGTSKTLSAPENLISANNSAMTKSLFGLSDAFPDSEFSDFIDWVLGEDPKALEENTPTHFIADPLHSRPALITYQGTPDPDNPTQATNLAQELVVTTNDGAFHMIDADTGETRFSYIPNELLSNQYAYYDDDSEGEKVYGLDGPLTVWLQESNDTDVTIESSDGDHVYVYFGQRRGGSNYYALDITNRNNPKLMWQINGGSGDFANMGQSWSKPVLGKVRIGCSGACTEDDEHDVLIFGGGYDLVHDNTTIATSGDAGAAIYMVDAVSGELLWSGGDTSINSGYDLDLEIANSIPGDVTVLDINGDKLSDVIFAVDILGKVWRVDLNNRNQTNQKPFSQGGLVADLSDNSQLRRFYNGPDVSIGQTESTPPFFVLAMGTGLMAHPRDTSVSDRFYVLFNHNVFNMPIDENGKFVYTTINNDDLLDLNDSESAPSPTSDGYYKDALESGEKFLRMPLTTSKIIFYTSYIPADDTEDTQCGVGYLGSGRLYAINFITGESVLDSGFLDLKHPGIPSEAVLLNINDGDKTKKVICVGTECFSEDDDRFEDDAFGTDYPHKAFWREN